MNQANAQHKAHRRADLKANLLIRLLGEFVRVIESLDERSLTSDEWLRYRELYRSLRDAFDGMTLVWGHFSARLEKESAKWRW